MSEAKNETVGEVKSRDLLDRIFNEHSNLESDIIAYSIAGRHHSTEQMVINLKKALNRHRQCLLSILDSDI